MTSLMTSLVAKMDSAFGNGKQLGEKAHVEYSWSKDLEELFVQYYFQLVRTKDHSDLIKKFTYCTRLNSMLLLLHSWIEHKTLRHSAAQSSSTECDRRELLWKRSFTEIYATSVSGLK